MEESLASYTAHSRHSKLVGCNCKCSTYKSLLMCKATGQRIGRGWMFPIMTLQSAPAPPPSGNNIPANSTIRSYFTLSIIFSRHSLSARLPPGEEGSCSVPDPCSVSQMVSQFLWNMTSIFCAFLKSTLPVSFGPRAPMVPSTVPGIVAIIE